MERFNREQPQERAERSPRKAGLPPWYKPQELQKIGTELNEPHCNSRSDGLQYRHGQPQDRDVTPSDDSGHAPPAFGSGFTPQLDASASTASDQGTLAGAYSWPQYTRRESNSDSNRSDSQLYSKKSSSRSTTPWRSPSNFDWQFPTRSPSNDSSQSSPRSVLH